MRNVAWAPPEIAGIGLVRTGTGSLSRCFPGKQVSHERGMPVLRPAALDRIDGILDDVGFLEATRERLIAGPTQVDISTVHHLYVDVLVDIWPSTMFVVTMRDVRSWSSSVLSLIHRKNAFLQMTGQELTTGDARYHRHLTGNAGRPFEECDARDVIPLMQYWADHHERVRRILDSNRVEYRCVGEGSGVQVNPSPIPSLDRFMMGAREALRQAYEATCADLMAELFPAHHAQLLHDWDVEAEPNWNECVRAVRTWADACVVKGTLPPGASNQGWT